MKNMLLTAAMMLAALGASAEGMPQMFGTDPLSRQIMMKTAQENGGVTAAVRVGSGQVIELNLSDVTAAPVSAPVLAPAAASPVLALKPAAGLAAKPVAKRKAKKNVRRAVEQLKRVAAPAGKTWR